MKTPLISIILCTYNGETFIDAQLQSLLSQTYKNIEIIVCDDASTDNTVNILTPYLNDKRIQFFKHEKNIGYIKNFEFATLKCNGNLIAFSDQDDIWIENKIETLYNSMGDYLLVYSDSELVDEYGKSLNKKLSNISQMYTGSDTRGFIFWNVVWGHTMMIKKELLQEALPIPINAPHDIWLAFKACTISGIKYVDIVLTKYRQHSKTVTQTTYKKEGNKKSRARIERYKEFEEKLSWINLLKENERPQLQPFYQSLSVLYTKKRTGKFVWPLFYFLIKNIDFIFMFRSKKLSSKIIECRKLARGEQQ